MDQKVIAGIGNVYRAELLFRQGLHPWLPGSGLAADTARRLWDDTVGMMSDGVRDGRIITTPRATGAGPAGIRPTPVPGVLPAVLPATEESHFVYRRHGLDCRDCGTPVALTELAAPEALLECPALPAP